jgi:hypothetical protein
MFQLRLSFAHRPNQRVRAYSNVEAGLKAEIELKLEIPTSTYQLIVSGNETLAPAFSPLTSAPTSD